VCDSISGTVDPGGCDRVLETVDLINADSGEFDVCVGDGILTRSVIL
jgi:hypothetical protein